MNYFDYITKMATLIKNYEKLMEEIKETKPYNTKFEGDLKKLYNYVWPSWDFINCNLKSVKNSADRFKVNKEKEYQEKYDEYSRELEDCKSKLENIKEQMEKQKSYDTGVMSGEQFKQKMLEIKKQLLDIMYEVEREDAYIFNQEDFEFFHTFIEKQLQKLDYAVGQYERGYTNGKYHYQTYSDFCIILSNTKKHWKTLQEENTFIAPR